MNQIQKNIKDAVDLLREISVKGDDVERMVAAKLQLEAAYQLAAAEQKDANGGDAGAKDEKKEKGAKA